MQGGREGSREGDGEGGGGGGWGQFVQGENRLKVQLGESSLLFGGVWR